MKEKATYEQSMKRLQEIVGKMERGEMDIDSLAANLKEARELIELCRTKLTTVEKDIARILDDTKMQ